MNAVLQLDRRDAVATLTLNRPASKNALNAELLSALANGFEQVANVASIRAVVLTGAGGAFCSGADLKGTLTEPGIDLERRLQQFQALVRGIVQAPKPFIAALSGPAVG